MAHARVSAGVLSWHPVPVLAMVILAVCCLSQPLLADTRSVSFYRAEDQKPQTAAEVASNLAGARIVILGEVHGSRIHHQVQLALLRELQALGVPLILGMEMFPASANPDLEQWSTGVMDSSELFLRFGQAWAFDWWPVYRDLLFHAREERIPLLGLNADEAVVRLVAQVGLDGLDAATRDALPRFSCSADRRYMELLGLAMNGMSSTDASFRKFCEAQILRDAFMARAALEAAKKNPERLLVILAGNYHAWRHGIASHLPDKDKLSVKIVLPGADLSFPDPDTLTEEADYVWLLD